MATDYEHSALLHESRAREIRAKHATKSRLASRGGVVYPRLRVAEKRGKQGAAEWRRSAAALVRYENLCATLLADSNCTAVSSEVCSTPAK